ncbi:hypothetical protein BDZ97DRAFT_1650519, partial [Flammula alnicola]
MQDEKTGDEVDPVLEPAGASDSHESSSSRRAQRHPQPQWLLSAFQQKVDECRNRDARGLPPLYRDLQTFWFPCLSPYFILRRDHVSPANLMLPRFFLWDPEPLCHGIPCPNCSKKLYRHDHVPFPRRCVDLNGSFWIIGFRYRCPNCTSAKGASATFRSWDSRILARLPPELAAEFPARLSCRSGISHSLFTFMRSCFQNGMGAKQFSDALRVQHLQKYDELHLQYLHSLATSRGLSEWRGQKFEDFLPFKDRSPNGPHGYVPSSQWLRDMYDHFIEEHQDELNQHTAMLSAEICAIDHSHKHISRVNGVMIFTGLLTVTNEKGEIRVCALVAMEAHSQFELALKKMRESLDQYGHVPPLAFYTDNVLGDKPFLESSFPSLLQDVVSVEKYADLEPLVLPSNIVVLVKASWNAIEDAARTVLDSLPSDGNGATAIGFDAEWNINTTSDGRIVGAMIEAGRLPQALMLLLSNPNVVKVGRMVAADLKYLESACRPSSPFVGALDLAKFAKERQAVTSAKCSLTDLCAAVLHKQLPKNTSSRISTAWEEAELSQEMLNYAALDAYASLLVYEKLIQINPPQPLPDNLAALTSIILYHDDLSRIIARGHISEHHNDTEYDGINITPKRTAVTITEVLVPGAIINSHRRRA